MGSSWNLYLGEFFAKGSGLGRKNRKIEWHPKRHPRQHLGKLVINRKLLDTYLFFPPVRTLLGNDNRAVAECFWEVVGMGLNSCPG